MSRHSKFLDVVDFVLGGAIAIAVAAAGSITCAQYWCYIGLRMLLHVETPVVSTTGDNLQATYLKLRTGLLSQHDDFVIWGFNKYQQAAKAVTLRAETIQDTVTNQWSSGVIFGETVALDEKLRHFRGRSPFIRKILSKPDRIGHMITEMAVMLEISPVPFVVGLHPFLSSKKLSISLSVEKIARWACAAVKLGSQNGFSPILIADSFYNSEASRKIYSDEGVKFIMALKPNSWSAMESLVSRGVKEPGDSGFARNDRNSMTVCQFYSMNNEIGRKTVVSTAHVPSPGVPFNRSNPPIYSEYAAAFAACDKFNKAMCSSWWPFRSSNWERHVSDTVLGIAFMNVHSACLELKLVPEGTTFKQTMQKVGLALATRSFKK